MSSPARIPRKLAIVITATSRWATWLELVREHGLDLGLVESSQQAGRDADHGVLLVPSGGEGVRDVALRDRRPCGLGMSAIATSRSTMPCSSGACSRLTILPPIEYRAILSEKKYCTNKMPKPMTRMKPSATCASDEHRDEDGVEQTEQEDRRQHPGGQPAVSRKLGTCSRAQTLLGTKQLTDLAQSSLPHAGGSSRTAGWSTASIGVPTRRISPSSAASAAANATSSPAVSAWSTAASSSSSLCLVGIRRPRTGRRRGSGRSRAAVLVRA